MHYIKIIITALLTISMLPMQAFALSIDERQDILSTRLVSVSETTEAKQSQVSYKQDQVVVKLKGENRFRTVRVTSGRSITQTLSELSRNPNVEYAEPDYIAYATAVPNDPLYSPYQWHLDNPSGSGINAEEAWNITTGSPDVIVAVIDTGVAYENRREGRNRYYLASDLANTCFVQGYDFINNDSRPNDDEGHGTHVAGTIAQSTNNNTGVAGVAYNTCIMPVKALDQNGSGSYSAIANAIYYSVDNGADIINMSLGGSAYSATLEAAVAYAYNNGVTVFAAAGNDNTSAPHYPSSYNDYVISVGATDYNANRAYYSNFGSDVDIAAPGGDVTVDANGDGYVDGVLQQTFGNNTNDFSYYFYQGTSMASPHAAGVAALLMAHGNATNPDDIREALESSARDIGDSSLGSGLIDAYAALQWTAGPIDNPPTVAILSPLANSTVSDSVLVSANASDDVDVTSVEFFINNSSLGSDLTAPYELSWDSTTITDGTHVVTAIATDSIGQTTEDSVNILVDNINDVPVADAGADQQVSDADGTGSEFITLDGSNSYDPDGTVMSYVWSIDGLIVGTSSSLMIDQAIGSVTYTLTVTDNEGVEESDTTNVTVLENTAPIADAGANQAVVINTPVLFDGSGSNDPDGSIASYDWDFGDGETGNGVAPSHSYTSDGVYTVFLTVTDNGGMTHTDSAEITVSATQPIVLDALGYKERGRQKVDLTWSGITTNLVDIYRDNVLIDSVSNDGTYTDNIDARGSGTYIYQICEDSTSNCSNESTVVF